MDFMLKYLQGLDFIKILSIGISGFGFLLILLAFLMIIREQNRKGDPRENILSIIKFFMRINLFNIIVVGLLGLPAIVNVDAIWKDVIALRKQNDIKSAELSVLGAGKNLENATTGTNTEKNTAIRELVKTVDSLRLQPAKGYDSLRIIQTTLKRQLQYLEQTPRKDSNTVKRSFDVVMENKNKLDEIILKQNSERIRE